MFKKLLSGLAMAAACIGSAQALVVDSSTSPTIYNFGVASGNDRLSSILFTSSFAVIDGYTFTTPITGSITLYSELNGAGAALYSTSDIANQTISIPVGTMTDAQWAEFNDGFSLVFAVTSGQIADQFDRVGIKVFVPDSKGGPPNADRIGTRLSEVGIQNAIPEPGTLALLALGVAAAVGVARRRRRN